MKKYILFYAAILGHCTTSHALAAQAGLGAAFEDAARKVKIGGRIQAVAETNSDTESQDAYLRRLRVNVLYRPWDGHQFVYDIRDDKANQEDRGEGEFRIGDAYWKIDIEKKWAKNVKLFRSKVDVSYSQTSSSKNLFNPNRPSVSEHASDFVVQNRRATNVQVNGSFGRFAYQLAVSDGVNSDDLSPVKESDQKVSGINYQKFTYGGKLRYFFIGDAKKNQVQDTFYGELDTFSLGLGYFVNDKINIALSNRDISIRRTLLNAELSYSYKNFRLLAEYFEFTGDLIDLSQTQVSDIIGDSNGHYIQAEYLIGKWAPYFGVEEFDKNADESGYAQNATYFGVNFYENLEARRYGIAYNKTDEEENLSDAVSERLYAYIMVNF